ncbi:hydrolase [Campylobacterota bacterium]|nr:hydrolase [Campylobacterota bacterium]
MSNSLQNPATVLFDLDGTLIDSTTAIVESFGVSFSHFNTPVPKSDAIVRLIGNPLSVMFATLGVENGRVEAFIARYKEHYRSVCLEKTHLIGGAKEALKTLAPHAAIGVVTTKTSRFSREILAHLGVAECIETIVGFDDVQNPKPDPEPILLALKRMERGAENAYMVGDTPIDIAAAQNAQITPIAVLSGYASRAELEPFGCAISENVLQAVKMIVQNITKEPNSVGYLSEPYL